ncbi:MAG: (2Fe-2S) ferredoxin domain-containing protein [Candidatus Thermoplasmatota archaeon]
MSLDAPYKRQLLVCTYGPWCRLDGADDIRAELKRLTKDAGLQDDIRITKSGCFGQCGHGPNIVVWPENVWYAGVKLDDVPELFESHVKNGTPVERLRYHPEKPGSNKTREVKEKEAKAHAKVD